MKILSIEDDATTAATLMSLLTQQHYIAEMAPDGEWAWQLLQQFEYDLIMLDITLPKLDGLSLCRKIRDHGIRTPILIVSSHDQIQEKAIGLDAGADDYLVKPFHPDELFARIRALLRRTHGESISNCIEWGNLHLNTSNTEVRYCSAILPLTPKEYAILELFLRHPQRVFSCTAILDNLWPNADAPSEEAVRTHIKGLRQKLKSGGIQEEVIETVYGIGYRLKAIEGETKSAIFQSDPIKTKALIQEVWIRSAERITTQLNTIQLGIEGLSQGDRQLPTIQQAHREAHTLAGSLGTFGFSEASHIAQQIERDFQQFHKLTATDRQQLQVLLNELRQNINL
jgi:DNA-binding response OmpR family regulator/HPt (histidine-containing phosphotransfer) domain-containing protein